MEKQRTLLIEVNEGTPIFYYIKPSQITTKDYITLNEYNNETVDIASESHPINIILDKLNKYRINLPIEDDMIVSEIIVIYKRLVF